MESKKVKEMQNEGNKGRKVAPGINIDILRVEGGHIGGLS
jgi:hypothetical protein